MIDSTEAYKSAVVADSRRVRLRAVVDISDPDKKYLPVTASSEAPWSKKEQLHDYDTSIPRRYVTGERGRWLGDGTFDIYPDNYSSAGQVGYGSKKVSEDEGYFSSPLFFQVNFSGVRVLQTFSVYFSGDSVDGFPVDFTADVISSGTSYYTQTITGNTKREISFEGFTVYTPDAIKLTVTRWSLPSRHIRAVEAVVGYFEQWDLSMLAEFSVSQRGRFDCLSLPYGTASLAMDNTDRRFEPRRKDSLFQSIEERQGVDLAVGVDTEGGTEYKPVGRYFQSGDGWKTSTNSATMKWNLVDIIGLVCNRAFLVPDTLPTTLDGWIKAVISQLGEAFSNYYHIDPAYKTKAVTANSSADVTGKSCGDIIRWACMVTGTWPRASQEDGALTVEPLWHEGNKYTLENLTDYPMMKANESLAALIFQLADGNNTQYVVLGNSTASEKTVTIQNPFIHTPSQALEASRLILSCYGGNVLELTGRGDPSSEIGDVDTVWLDESSAATARRMDQTFQFQDGVMQGCKSTLLQADGSYLWENYAVIRESGTWKAPPGVSQLRLVLGDGGQGGGYGEDGYIRDGWTSVESGYGDPGQDGQGGKVWYGVVDINLEQEFTVQLGGGGAPASAPGVAGSMGGHTTFGVWSSEDGTYYPNGYTDIASGNSFARTGVPQPLPGTGDGGKGGDGGEPGAGYREYVKNKDGEDDGRYYFHVTKRPGKGKPGAPGASGFALVTWDRPAAQT